MEEADILPNEMVLVVNLKTGARFETYTIAAEKNSGTIGLQGGAALLGEIGDRLIIISSCLLEDREACTYKPKFTFVNEKNKIIHTK
jgi:aspartate 1-decarboxylase